MQIFFTLTSSCIGSYRQNSRCYYSYKQSHYGKFDRLQDSFIMTYRVNWPPKVPNMGRSGVESAPNRQYALTPA